MLHSFFMISLLLDDRRRLQPFCLWKWHETCDFRIFDRFMQVLSRVGVDDV